jgi:hypothetical protein
MTRAFDDFNELKFQNKIWACYQLFEIRNSDDGKDYKYAHIAKPQNKVSNQKSQSRVNLSHLLYCACAW